MSARAASWLLAILLLLACAEAFAQTSVVFTTTSYHFNRDKGYNERNLGVGLEYRLSDEWAIAGGFYRNSFYRHSNYVMGAYTPFEMGGWRAGGLFGIVTGYDSGPTPVALGLVTKGWGRFGINIVAVPSVVGLQVKWTLD